MSITAIKCPFVEMRQQDPTSQLRVVFDDSGQEWVASARWGNGVIHRHGQDYFLALGSTPEGAIARLREKMQPYYD